MGEPKAFASLSSGLLARKGAARPAMRPQGFGQLGSGLEDLGWNDMGFEAPKAAVTEADATHDAFGAEIAPHPVRNPLAGLTPVNSPVHDQQDEIAARFAKDSEDEDEAFDEDYDDTAELFEDAEARIAELSAAQPETFEPLAIEPVAHEPGAFEPVVAQLPVEAATDPVVVEAPFEPVAVETERHIVVAPVAEAAPRRAPRARSAPGTKAKAAFTLRLDKDRHLKLRLACAVDGRSAQQIVTAALDAFLASMPELDRMAERAPGKAK